MGKSKTKMSALQLTVIVAVNMMGSGIIMLPSNLAQVGTISIISWIVTALGALALAWTFAQCGMLSRNSGGMGGYAQYTFGKSGNFMANYGYAVSLVISNVAISVSVVAYATVFLGITLSPIANTLAIIFVIWLSTVVNFGSASLTGKFGSVVVWGIIIPLVLLVVIGWFWFSPSQWIHSWNPHHYTLANGIKSAIPLTLWAFLGLESASANMDAVENPQKNVPIACLAGTIIAAVLYIISTEVMAGIVPLHALATSNAPFGLAFATMFNPTVGKIIMGLMVIACFGSLMAWQFTVAEVFRSSAFEGYFPKIFTKVTSKEVPIVGMIILAIVQTVFAFMTISPNLNAQFQVIVNLAVVTNMVPYLLSMASLQNMQIVEKAKFGAKKLRFNTIIAVLAGIYTLYALYTAGSQAMLYGGIVAMAGWTIYGFLAHRFNKEEGMLA
ncbi:putrescine-ornithine antiporter [uncultured Clostridium sp.]|uniref:putrescine-ornithine antiporter n=1 Tax=uncultured Clostridium sp. TaxID=59620 RepID=UPI002608749C|nr:putrescine-ornithine antiporter [uncultured Clostridium sp.]